MDMTRRQFVKSVAATGATLVAAKNAVAQDAGGDELKLAIIGTGRQGRILLQDALSTAKKGGGIRFVAICDIWSFSQRYAKGRCRAAGQTVNVYEDYREMLATEKDLDAVIVATPDFMHAEHAVACLEAGKHVYCEKEMSNTLETAQKMVEAAKRTGKLLQVGHQRRSNPVYQYALQLMKADNICGRLTTCYGQWNRGVQPYNTLPENRRARLEVPAETLKKYGYENMEQFMNWRWFKKHSAGPIADLGSHQIDIFSWFLENNPQRVVAMGSRDVFGREWYEDVTCLYEYRTSMGGKTGSARAYYQVLNTNSYGAYFERFSGDGGSITISEDPRKCYYAPEPGRELPEWAQGLEFMKFKKPGGEVVADLSDNRDGHPVYSLTELIARKSPEAAAAMKEAQEKNVHQLHLENFFKAARAGDRKLLNCDGEEAYATAVAVLKVVPAIEAGSAIALNPEDFRA